MCERVKEAERDSCFHKKKKEAVQILSEARSRSLALFVMSGSRLTLKPACLPDCVCQAERPSLDGSINKHKQNSAGH